MNYFKICPICKRQLLYLATVKICNNKDHYLEIKYLNKSPDSFYNLTIRINSELTYQIDLLEKRIATYNYSEDNISNYYYVDLPWFEPYFFRF